MNYLPRLLLTLSVLFLGACATLPKEYVEDKLSAEAPRQRRLTVPFVSQDKNTCGPSVLKMVSTKTAPQYTLEMLKQMSFREEAQGAFKADILSAARRMGLAPYRVTSLQGMLIEVQQDRPVIVFQNLALTWLPVWHYALLVGYNAHDNTAILHSGTTAYEKMPFHRFADTWRRGESWSYVILSPHEIPQEARFEDALDNGMLLEKVGHHEAARSLYARMGQRWPERFEPHLGLANFYYQHKNLKRAIQESELALSKQPNHSALLFNLAWLYHEAGIKNKAAHFKKRTLAEAPAAEKKKYEERFSF